jgi:hypothetical protein
MFGKKIVPLLIPLISTILFSESRYITFKELTDEKWGYATGWTDSKHPLPKRIGRFTLTQERQNTRYISDLSDVYIRVFSFIPLSGKVMNPMTYPIETRYALLEIEGSQAGISESFKIGYVTLIFRGNDQLVFLECHNATTYEQGKEYLTEIGKELIKLSKSPANKSLQPTPPAPLQSPALQSTKSIFEKQNINQLSSFVLG